MRERRIKGLVSEVGSSGVLSRLGTVILAAMLTSLVVAQLGLTMTSVVTSACASLAVSCVLVYVGGLRIDSTAPTLCGLLALCAVLPSEGARDYAELLGVSLAVGVALLLLSIAPVRNRVLSGIPAHLRVGMSALLGVLSVEFALRLCGMVTVDSNGALGLVGIFDPAFVDASISLLATVTLRCSGVPAAGILGLCIATFAGIPLGLTQAPAGFLAAPDVTLIAYSSSGLVTGAARLLQGLFSARSLGLIFSLALCLLSTSDAEPEDASGKRSGQVLGALGMLASAFLGIPMIGLAADRPKESCQRPLKEGACLAASALVVACLSPLVACIPVSAAFGPLLVCCLRPISRVACIGLKDLGASVPVLVMVSCGLVSGSPAWGVAAGVLVDTCIRLGSGKARSLSGAFLVLSLASLAFVLATTGL